MLLETANKKFDHDMLKELEVGLWMIVLPEVVSKHGIWAIPP
jgi:hypothetical protein